MKRRTNHEGQPRLQTSQLTDAVDTAAQKLTHPKVRESQQGDDTVAQRADTTPTGAPVHRVQNPANPSKPARAGEAQKKEGKCCRATYATRVAEGQAPGDRKGRKSPREPVAGEAAQTAGPGGRAGHKVENQATHQRHLQPNNKAPPQE